MTSVKRIFITGCAGFIGFHLARALRKMAGIEVVGIDNFNSYYSPELKRARAELLQHDGVFVEECDLLDHEKLKSAIFKFQPTHVINLAAWAGVRYAIQHPDVYVKNNIDGFLSLLNVMKELPKVPLIYASSSSVYGKNKKVPFAVGDATDLPANIYGMTKKSNELMAFAYHNIYNIPMVGHRFFTVYGPWGRPDMAYFHFTKAIFEGKAIDLYNFGDMRRDFTYIDDIVAGIIASLTIQEGYHLYNLGASHSEPLQKLVSCLEKAIGKKAHINLKPMIDGDVYETFADVKKSEQDLGFKPTTSLEEGIPRFVDWYRNYYGL